MLAVAFLPHPPALLPSLSGDPVPGLAEVRAAARDALSAVLGTGPETVLVLGSADPGRVRGLRGIGGPARALPAGPLSIAVADALLDVEGWTGPRRRLVVSPDAGDDDLQTVAASVASGAATPTAVLVMGDGSACRHPDAPGGLHPDAGAFDDAVAAALGAGDAPALAALDAGLGAHVRAAGTVVWRVVGRALATRSVTGARLRYHDAPFGVAYLVAEWTSAS